MTALKVTALVLVTAVVGARMIPRILDYVANTRSRELFTLTVLVLALGIAVGSALIFSVSMALGAFLAGMVFVWLMKYPLRAALTSGLALAQIGEFSFILASMGRDLGVLPDEATNALVAPSIISIVLNPVAYRTIRPIERWVSARPRLWAAVNRPSATPADLAPADRDLQARWWPAHRSLRFWPQWANRP